MANAKEIVFGVIGVSVLASAFLPNAPPPPPPEICKVPQFDGTYAEVSVQEIPCDEIVKDALAELNKAKAIEIPDEVRVIDVPDSTEPIIEVRPLTPSEEENFFTPPAEMDNLNDSPME